MQTNGAAGRRTTAAPLWRNAIVAVLAIQTGGFLIGTFFGPQPGGWYFQIEKPSFTPPPWVFPVAWTLLYTMMGVAAARIWRASASDARRAALIAFGLQLALNYAWSVVFFGFQAPVAATVGAAALLAAIVYAIWRMAAVDRLAAWLMAPYAAWAAFALVLTAVIAQLNA